MPENLPALIQVARARLARLSAGQRRGILYGVSVLGIAAALLLAVGSYQPYGVLFSNLEPGEAQAAVEALRAAQVPYELEDGGRTLRVPQSQIDSMRVELAAAGTVGQVAGGYEILDTLPFGASDVTIKLRQRRALEGELARTISSIRGVRSARVHLSTPEPSIFDKDARRPSASVVVALEGGAALERDEVRGIRNLVAHGVERLDSKDVSVIDDRGHLLTEDDGGAVVASERQRAMESALEQRLISLLSPVVGEGMVTARVTVDLDTSSTVETSKVYQPEQSAVRSEERSEDERKVGGDPAGLAGAQANTAGSGNSAVFGEGSVGSSAREVTNYEVSYTQMRTKRGGGTLRRLSAAVLVGPRQVEGPAGSGTTVEQQRSPEEVERLRALAMTAIGFDASRGDQLQIESMSFVQTNSEVGTTTSWAPLVLPVAKFIGVALLALAVVVFALRPILRSGQRAMVEVARDNPLALDGYTSQSPLPQEALAASLPAPSEEMHVQRERALDAALENSERAAEIVRAWLASDAESEIETLPVENEVAA
ncbi:MAG: flagellar basal-body MS-ring/collar protein FliF [Pseudomonadota bacterium]